MDQKNGKSFENSVKKTENNKNLSMDEFWDISKLVPKAKNEFLRKDVHFDTNTVDIISESPENCKVENASSIRSSLLVSMEKDDLDGTEFKKFIPPYNEKHIVKEVKPDLEYTNENSLIKRVKVFNWPLNEKYKSRFIGDAKALLKAEGSECENFPYFSYMPQYNQLNKAQLNFYLWLRTNFRKGIYLDTDYSYILLYVYEIINLSDTLDKNYCIDELCKIWKAYKDKYEFLAKYLCEWVCDFCLIYNLPPPIEKIKEIYPFVLKNSFLKEFYISDSVNGKRINAEMLLSFCVSYDYKKSRYATGDRLIVLESYIKRILEKVIKVNAEKGNLFYGLGFTDSKVTRISFSGAYCAPEIKKRIEIEYSSFSRSHELNYFIADIIRYTENKLRAAWGIKSRLSIYALQTNVRKCIDEYFDENPVAKNDLYDKKGNKKVNEYDKLYDTPQRPLSLSKAAKIEQKSWETTKILVETFNDDDELKFESKDDLCLKSVSLNTKSDGINCVSSDLDGDKNFKDALGNKYEFLKAVLNGDRKLQNKIIEKLNILPEALIDEINEISENIIGDIIIDENNNGDYIIVDDYKELI